MNLKRLVITVASVFCFLATAAAQQPQSRNTATGLTLEITMLKGIAPEYLPVLSKNMPRGGAWYPRFDRIAEWHLPAGEQPIYAVRLVPFVEADTVRINVSVLRGEKFLDSEEAVGSYSGRENERLSLEALKNFGVEPFEVKIVRVAQQLSDLPAIVNQSKSVEVVGIEPLLATFPAFKLTLRNLSAKNISALTVQIMGEGKVKLSGMPQGKEGEPLIRAGDSTYLNQPLATRAEPTPAGYAPGLPSAQQIVITAVVFEDCTYEGDARSAATLCGFTVGRRLELKRLVPVLESSLATAASPESFRAQLSDLSFEVDASYVASLAEAFPGIEQKRLRSPIETAVHGIRKQVLDQLQSFEQDRHSVADFQNWLRTTKEQYANWLARLDADKLSYAQP
jgi:hypothetical protein